MIYYMRFYKAKSLHPTTEFIIADNAEDARLRFINEHPNHGEIVQIKPLERLTKAIDEYYDKEFLDGRGSDEIDDFANIGIACTDLFNDDDVNDVHEMQISLNLYETSFIYYLDDKEIYREYHPTIDECAEEIENCDFQSWYSDFLVHCPNEDLH